MWLFINECGLAKPEHKDLPVGSRMSGGPPSSKSGFNPHAAAATAVAAAAAGCLINMPTISRKKQQEKNTRTLHLPLTPLFSSVFILFFKFGLNVSVS